jgi:predicted regulator of Ras-like GTPase activity (Roadblock/LC7/MglB family)
MFTLPQILEEDVWQLNAALSDLLVKCEATLALVIDKGGFVVTKSGDSDSFDDTTLAALAAASFSATQAISNVLNEPDFSSVYQQGEHCSILVSNVDEFSLLVVIFRANVNVGMVKYYAATTIIQVAKQLKIAHLRAPDAGVDLSLLNMADTSYFFKKRPAE